jgi:ubiquinone biosynthesis monooxygenase Coq6
VFLTLFHRDAAHSVHPLAGQGVNLGFGDAQALAAVIAKGVSTGRDIGETPWTPRAFSKVKAKHFAGL